MKVRSQLKVENLKLLLNEALNRSDGDVVELDMNLAEQIALALEHLVASLDDAPKTSSFVPKKQSRLFK